MPLAAEGGRIRVALAALCAIALLGVAASVTPPSAHAAFTLAECQGGPTKGEGSSLQATARTGMDVERLLHVLWLRVRRCLDLACPPEVRR